MKNTGSHTSFLMGIIAAEVADKPADLVRLLTQTGPFNTITDTYAYRDRDEFTRRSFDEARLARTRKRVREAESV